MDSPEKLDPQRYRIVTARNPEDLTRKLNLLEEDGWKRIGATLTRSGEDSAPTVLCQSMFLPTSRPLPNDTMPPLFTTRSTRPPV